MDCTPAVLFVMGTILQEYSGKFSQGARFSFCILEMSCENKNHEMYLEIYK